MTNLKKFFFFFNVSLVLFTWLNSSLVTVQVNCLAAPLVAGAGILHLLILSSQTSVLPWMRVMASLCKAVHCYCRITERLIETNDSNNETLSPQAGFVVGLISVAVAVKRTSHHADP